MVPLQDNDSPQDDELPHWGALADVLSAQKVISLIAGVIRSQLIQLITNLLITQPYPGGRLPPARETARQGGRGAGHGGIRARAAEGPLIGASSVSPLSLLSSLSSLSSLSLYLSISLSFSLSFSLSHTHSRQAHSLASLDLLFFVITLKP